MFCFTWWEWTCLHTDDAGHISSAPRTSRGHSESCLQSAQEESTAWPWSQHGAGRAGFLGSSGPGAWGGAGVGRKMPGVSRQISGKHWLFPRATQRWTSNYFQGVGRLVRSWEGDWILGCGFIILSGVLVFSIIRGVREKWRCCSNFNMVLRDSRTGRNRQCESWRGSSSQQPLFLTFISRYNGNMGSADAVREKVGAIPVHAHFLPRYTVQWAKAPGSSATCEATSVQRFTVKFLRKSVQAAERWGFMLVPRPPHADWTLANAFHGVPGPRLQIFFQLFCCCRGLRKSEAWQLAATELRVQPWEAGSSVGPTHGAHEWAARPGAGDSF